METFKIRTDVGEEFNYTVDKNSDLLGYSIATCPIVEKIEYALKKIKKMDIINLSMTRTEMKDLDCCNMDKKDLVGKYYDEKGFIYYEINNKIYRFYLKIIYFKRLYNYLKFENAYNILQNLMKDYKKERFIITFSVSTELDFIQYLHGITGLILYLPYKFEYDKNKKNGLFLKIFSLLKTKGYRLTKRRSFTELKYKEYWKFSYCDLREKIINKSFYLNIGKNIDEIISLTKSIFNDIYNYDDFNNIIISIDK